MDDGLDDIYADLPDFELDKECERLQHEVEDLKLKTDQFSAKIDKLTEEKNKLIKQKSILLKNISILLKTAKQEIQRKDEIILHLRQQLQAFSKSKANEESKPPDVNTSQSQPAGEFSINEKLLKLAGHDKVRDQIRRPSPINIREKTKPAKKSALSELNWDLDKPALGSSNIRDRLGPKVEHEKKSLDLRSTRGEDRHHRDHNERYRGREYRRDLEVLEDNRSQHRKLTKPQHRNSRSPPRNIKARSPYSKPRSRSPNSKIKLTGLKSRSGGRKEICAVSPPFTLEKNHLELGRKTDVCDNSISRENRRKSRDQNTITVDDCIKVNNVKINEVLGSSSPVVSDNTLKTNHSEKEEGEMSDSDPLEGEEEELSFKCIQKLPKKRQEAPKTLFTLRMEQKLKREDEERRRKQTAANISDKIDVTLFDKPIKVIRPQSKELFSREPSHPKPACESDQRLAHLEVNNCGDIHKSIDENVNSPEQSKEIDSESNYPKLQEPIIDSNKQHHLINESSNLQSSANESTKLLNPDNESNEVQHQTHESNNIPNPVNESNNFLQPVTESNFSVPKKEDKPKLTLNIFSRLNEALKSQSASDTVAAADCLNAKQSSVETFSPFKDNYKLIEFSPMPPAQHKPLAFVSYKSEEHLRDNLALQNCNAGFGSEPKLSNNKPSSRGTEIHNKVSPRKKAIFDIKKPLKPLSPHDILGISVCATAKSSPSQLINKPDNLNSDPPKTIVYTSEQKSVIELITNAPLDTSKMKSYRIPKKTSNSCINPSHQKTLSDKGTVKSGDRKRRHSSPEFESKKPRSTICRKDTDSRLFKNETHHRKEVNKITTTKEDVFIASSKKGTSDEVSKYNTSCKSTNEKGGLREKRHKHSPAEPNVHKKVPKSINSVRRKEEISDSKKTGKSDLSKEKVADKIQVKDKPTKSNSVKQDKWILKGSEKEIKTQSARSKPEEKLKESKTRKGSGSKERARDKSKSINQSESKVESTKIIPIDEELAKQNHTLLNVRDNKLNEQIPESEKSPKKPSPKKTTIVVTPYDHFGDISAVALRLDEPPPTPRAPDLENAFYAQSTKENYDDRDSSKKQDLMSGLNLDVTPQFPETSLGLDKNKSPVCPITPDLPSDLQTSDKLSTISIEERNCTRTPEEKKSGENCDIANFEIFKSVNMNSSSPNVDRSKESSCTNRLQNDLSLSETESESESETSGSENSDSGASDLVDMF